MSTQKQPKHIVSHIFSRTYILFIPLRLIDVRKRNLSDVMLHRPVTQPLVPTAPLAYSDPSQLEACRLPSVGAVSPESG
jgi:hypothetical protein